MVGAHGIRTCTARVSTSRLSLTLAPMTTGATGSDEDRPVGAWPEPLDDGSVRHRSDRSAGAPMASDDGSFEGAPPSTTGDAAGWLLLAGLGFVLGQVLSAVMLLAVAAANGHLSDVSQLAARATPPAWVVVSGLVGLWVGFVGAVVLASRHRGTGSVVRDMGLRVERWDVLIGIGVGLFGQFILVNLLYLPFEQFNPRLAHELQQPAKRLTGGFPGVDLAVIAVLTVVVVPVVEELFFRGLILRGFVRLFRGAGPALGPVLAVTTTGIVFGLAHAEALELLGLAAFGIVLSALAFKFRRLGPGIFAHASFNLVAILFVAFPGTVRH